MKRAISCIMSVLLALYAVPAFAFATPVTAGAIDADAEGAGAFEAIEGDEGAAALSSSIRAGELADRLRLGELAAQSDEGGATSGAHAADIPRATGAPRAAGRTADTVGALTDAARAATSGFTFGELAGAGAGAAVPSIVHVAQFGAYGDGLHDDRAALQAALNSGAKTILFEQGATYKVNASLKLRHGDVVMLGNGATIFTDADYNDGDERLLSITGRLPEASLREAVADSWESYPQYFIENVGVYELNMEARAYDPADAAADKEAYSKQLMVQMAKNVDIFGCAFTTEHPEGGRVVDGFTALDAYTGWRDLTIENCVVRDFCDKEGGGGIWIRDHFNMGASNMVFARNDLHKVCHDEILAVFNTNVNYGVETARPVTDVLIVGNAFTMDEDVASSSVMAFTVKCARNVLVENNDIDVKTTGGLLWSSYSSGVVVRDNDIVQTRSPVSGSTNFLMFRDTVDLVENNRMQLKAVDESGGFNDVYVFAMDGAVRNNTVVSDLPLDYVTNGPALVEGNDIRLNAPVHVVFNAGRVVSDNRIELNAHADTYFQYFRDALAEDAALTGNVFDNRVVDDTHTVLMMNDATLSGHVVRFTGNELANEGLKSGARLLFLKLSDETAQTNCVVFSGNIIPDLATYGVYCPDARHTYTAPTSDGGGLAQVRGAIAEARAYLAEHEMGAPALAAAVEHVSEDIECFSVGKGRYYLLSGSGHYVYDAEGGAAAGAEGDAASGADAERVAASADAEGGAVSAVTAAGRLAVYDTLAAAQAAQAEAASAGTVPDAFLTRGRDTAGDGGHGYYTRVDSLAVGQPGVTLGAATFALTSAESAVSVRQLGYAGGSVNGVIDAFHASSFHTLAFPEGEYQLTADVYSRYDNRSYYGFDATLFTDGAITLGARNASHKSLWVIRGDIEWGAGTETYEAVNDNGTTTVKKKDVFHTVRNVELAGLAFERRNGEGATSGYNRFVVVRQARNVTLNRCSIDAGAPISGNTTTLRGASILLYGDYDGVTVSNCTLDSDSAVGIIDLCDHVDNIPASWQVDADNPTGGRNVVVRGCDFTTHNFDESLPIFAGNEQGLTKSDGSEYDALTHCLIENVTIEDNVYRMLEPETTKKRVVAITCGYQDSPVRNVHIERNTFDVSVNGYLILFGYAQDCTFADNDVTMRATGTSGLVPVVRSTHDRTGPASGLRVERNTIQVPGESASVARMVDPALTASVLTFSHNDVTVAGSVDRVFDSTADSTDNAFHLNAVKRLYGRVGQVARNTYEISTLTGLYESYGANAQADLDIRDESASIGTLTGNLLTFNGTPSYHGHSISFTGCAYDIASATSSSRRIAGSTAAITDGLELRFLGCEIPFFDSAPYNTISGYGSGKVAFVTSAPGDTRDTAWNVTWSSWVANSVLASMDPRDDGFARTLVVDVPASSPTTCSFADGDGSPGSIVWAGGGHTLAAGTSAAYELTCRGGIWYEAGAEPQPADPDPDPDPQNPDPDPDPVGPDPGTADPGSTDPDPANPGSTDPDPGPDPAGPTPVPGDAHVHAWGPWAVALAPFCTMPGVERRVCTLDSSHIEEREIAPIGHVDDGGKVTAEPTATTDGILTHRCAICGAALYAELIPATGQGEGGQRQTDGSGGASGTGGAGDASGAGSAGGAGGASAPGADDAAHVTFTVFYAPNGGSGSMTSSIVAPGAEVVVRPCGFTREGYTFAGWAMAADSSVRCQPGDSLTVAGDIVLSAMWRKEKAGSIVPVYSLMRRSNGDHVYTASATEAARYRARGYVHRGIAFYAPKSGRKVYCLANKAGLHRYTAKAAEVRTLKARGWKSQGVAFRAAKSGGMKVYRLKNRESGAFMLVKGASAAKAWKKVGWKSQGVAFRARK